MRSTAEQIRHYLSDLYSMEQQALAQLVSAPELAGDPGIAEKFRMHHAETEQQADAVRERLEAYGGSPSALKDAVMKLGGKCFLLFARVQPETPGRLVAHAYSYEAMEWAGYELLIQLAERASDTQTAMMAKGVQAEEATMMERLEESFDAAERASHEDTPADELPAHIRKHLAEAHALEAQAIGLLTRGEQIAGDSQLERIYTEYIELCQRHARDLEHQLTVLGGDTSTLKDEALAAGGANWALFFQAQSDTPGKLAAFVFAIVHLKIGGYELLWRSAQRAGDETTSRLCERILDDERAMARRIGAMLAVAADATLAAV